jgi:hypothetical protein
MSQVFHVESSKLRKDIRHGDFNQWTLRAKLFSGPPGQTGSWCHHSDPDNEVRSCTFEHVKFAYISCLLVDQYIFLSLYPSFLDRIALRVGNIEDKSLQDGHLFFSSLFNADFSLEFNLGQRVREIGKRESF